MQINSNSLSNIPTNYSARASDTKESSEEETKKENLKSENELSDSEKQMVSDLQARDTEVRAHESAHQSAGAATGGASFTYQQGPDGKMYTIGGEVSISMSSGSTPQETIVNAQAVIAAALAPADPSSQDMAVASSAMVMMMKAQQQVARKAQEELTAKEVYKSEALTNNEPEAKSSGIDIPA